MKSEIPKMPIYEKIKDILENHRGKKNAIKAQDIAETQFLDLYISHERYVQKRQYKG